MQPTKTQTTGLIVCYSISFLSSSFLSRWSVAWRLTAKVPEFEYKGLSTCRTCVTIESRSMLG